MAGRKEYEMLFALNARMNGGFSGTFSKAQAEFSRLGREIQDLHKLQGNIASYQKQQAAIEATRAKLENLQKQHDLLQKEIGETNGSTAGLERESVKLEQRIKDTEAALERQGQKLDATGAKLREAGVDTSNLAQKDVELTAKIKELQAEQEKAADSAERFGDQTAKALDAIASSEVTSAVVDGLGKIKDAFVECIDIAGNFEEAMSTVEALSGASAQEMAALAEEAKDLGATTKFTAKEAGDAMGYMAMAGWDASDMLQGMDGVLQLAAASGEDLAMVSDIVTDSLSAFGLTAKDTAHFSDVLAAAATNSNTNVAIMGETFKMSASVAGALGYSIEDVAVAMGLMANSGVKGSIAGTALRNTFNGLLEGVTLTGAAFGEYEYSAIKADGTMKGFGSTIDELRGYFERMTEAERVANAQAIAGQRGYNGLLAILNATDADYASLTNSINNCTGAAQRMANVKLDNMNGQLTLMKSAWDALKTTIGEQFIPEMRGLYEIGTDVFSVVNEFIKANPGLVKGVAAGAAVIGTVTAALLAYSAGAKIAAAASALLSASIPGVNIIMGVTAAVAGITAAVVALATSANEGVPSVKELTEAAREMGETMDEAADTYDKTVTATLAAAGVADTYITKLEEMGDYARLSKEEQEQYHNTLVLLTQVVPELASSIDLENNAIEGGTAALRANTEAWKQNAMAQAYQDQLTAMYQSYSAVLIEAEENSIGLTRAQYDLEAANQKCSNTIDRINELWAEAQQQADKNYREYGTLADATAYLTQEYYDLQNSLYDINDEIYTAEQTARAYEKAINEDAEAVAAAEAEIELAEEAVRNLTGATEEQAEAEAEAAAQTQELQGVFEDITSQVAALAEAYNEAYGAALDSISGQYALWDEAAAVVETSAGSINSALESQITYWQGYNANLQSLTDRAADIDGLSEVIASFADGSEDSVNAIAGLANASDEDLRAMVTNWQALQEEQEAAAGSVADLKTDFSSTMDELQKELAEDIEAMDLGDEAAAAGRATIQGYVDAANDMLPAVRNAYANLAQAAQSAMGYKMVYVPSSNAYVPQRGYASGTENAEPGWAMVGEDGPELMFFNGGEKVLDASRTSALQARPEPALSAMVAAPGGGSSSVQVVFQIAGNATPDTVQALQDYGDDFAERVMEVVENAAADAARGAYR
ncbi:phage tail tape measure protein [uncultured Oscillibacter sp.]|uniref:phage tail tape measure protein n=1 Tax=uncultured Oscillibacter sp. TaxID=876091 RepID=UPI00262C0A7F|nr:phage tail tape measure protein [uncultured Oscillibacter sp.]